MIKKNPYEIFKHPITPDTAKPEDLAETALEDDYLPNGGDDTVRLDTLPCDEATECPLCQEAKDEAARAMAEAEDMRLRALADLDNARKRLAREKEEATRYAASNVLSDILPALDNLDLAMEHAKGNEACKDLLLGVEMTRKLLLDSLKRHGLESVGTEGDAFDPNIHEAISMASHPDLPDGAICTLLSRGYRLNDRLLRPARVVVCKK